MSDSTKPLRGLIFDASVEALAALLQLPEGAHIDAVMAPVDQPGVLRFRIRGIGPERELGDHLPQFHPDATERDGGGVALDWSGADLA